MAFDAIHDQVDPAGVLGNVRRALADDGLFFMVDFKFPAISRTISTTRSPRSTTASARCIA
jgi:hypothetical protein